MEENNIQPQEQQEVSQHEDARIVVLREEDIKRLINAIKSGIMALIIPRGEKL